MKDKYWWFGINSWWGGMCFWLGKPEWVLYKPAPPLPSEPPEPEPPEPEPPKPEPWEPEKPVLHKKLKYLELDYLDWFVDDFLPAAWVDLEQARKDMYQVLKQTCHELGDNYPNAWSGFLVLSSGKPEHEHCNKKLPWKIKNGKIDFYDFNEKWWKIFKAFIQMLRLFKIQVKPQAFMDGVYNEFPFKNNVNDINGFWSSEAFDAEIRFVRKILMAIKEVWGNNYVPYIKFINEPRLSAPTVHDGDHIIADWHRDMYLSISGLTDLKHIIVDNSMREATLSQLIHFSPGEERCPKCNKPWDNKPEYDRLITHEKHGVTCPESLEGYERNWFSLSGFLGSGWGHVKVSEDGGFYPEAKGYRLFDHKISWGNAAQLEKMLTEAWGKCKAHKRRKEFYFGIWPAEVFVKTEYGIRQIYRPDRIIWARFRAVKKVYNKVYET